jgi:hypothetical protein
MKSRFFSIIALAILVLGATALSVVPVSASVGGGLLGRYWQDTFFGVEPLPYPEWIEFDMPPPGPYPQPDMVQTDPTINFLGTAHPPAWNWRPFGPGHQFSVKWTGYINIPGTPDEGAPYEFRLTSDDGSWLFIDGALEINNPGVHGPSAVDGSIILDPGSHEIVIDFYETANTECGIVFYWKPPGATDWEIVPSTVLVPEPLPNPTGGVPEFSIAVPLVTSLASVIYLAIRKRIGKNPE